jgi:hypothetical protein
MTDPELFVSFPKIYRYSREVIVTEKIDGTNGQISIDDNGILRVGSRSRWLSFGDDNFGFYKWASDHADQLRQLGPGRHFGEWWGYGIQRGYGLKEKRFSLFNVVRWTEKETPPACCHVVPVLWRGMFDELVPAFVLQDLKSNGSAAAPGFNHPEGIIIHHLTGNVSFKKTIYKDEEHKNQKP